MIADTAYTARVREPFVALLCAWLVVGCAGMTDYKRGFWTDQFITRVLRDSGDDLEKRKIDFLAIAADVEKLAGNEGITGNAFNAGLDLLADEVNAKPEDVALVKFLISELGVTVPDLSLPVTDEHLRIVGVYIAAVRKSVNDFTE